MKKCYMCKEILPLGEFHQDNSRPDGKSSRCKKCNTIHCRKYTQSREKHRVYELKYYYGMTEADYDKLVLQQKGVCAICKTNKEDRLAVDHDHETGKIRELLCRTCNSAIGLLGDSAHIAMNAAIYLEETKR